MSKFCGVVSACKSRQLKEREPLLDFQTLDIITSWLHDDIEELEHDFNVKIRTMQNQQQQIYRIELELNQIDRYIADLNKRLLIMEIQIQMWKDELASVDPWMCSEIMKKTSNEINYCVSCKYKHTYASLLRLIMKIDIAIMQFSIMMEEITKYTHNLKQIKQRTRPLHTIFGIVESYVHILMKTDRCLDELADKSRAADDSMFHAVGQRK